MENKRLAIIPLSEYDELTERIKDLEKGLVIISYSRDIGYHRVVIETKDQAIAEAYNLAKEKDKIIERQDQVIDEANAKIRQYKYELELFSKKFSRFFKLLKFFRL
jgi:hypothetical protein